MAFRRRQGLRPLVHGGFPAVQVLRPSLHVLRGDGDGEALLVQGGLGLLDGGLQGAQLLLRCVQGLLLNLQIPAVLLESRLLLLDLLEAAVRLLALTLHVLGVLLQRLLLAREGALLAPDLRPLLLHPFAGALQRRLLGLQIRPRGLQLVPGPLQSLHPLGELHLGGPHPLLARRGVLLPLEERVLVGGQALLPGLVGRPSGLHLLRQGGEVPPRGPELVLPFRQVRLQGLQLRELPVQDRERLGDRLRLVREVLLLLDDQVHAGVHLVPGLGAPLGLLAQLPPKALEFVALLPQAGHLRLQGLLPLHVAGLPAEHRALPLHEGILPLVEAVLDVAQVPLQPLQARPPDCDVGVGGAPGLRPLGLQGLEDGQAALADRVQLPPQALEGLLVLQAGLELLLQLHLAAAEFLLLLLQGLFPGLLGLQLFQVAGLLRLGLRSDLGGEGVPVDGVFHGSAGELAQELLHAHGGGLVGVRVDLQEALVVEGVPQDLLHRGDAREELGGVVVRQDGLPRLEDEVALGEGAASVHPGFDEAADGVLGEASDQVGEHATAPREGVDDFAGGELHGHGGRVP